MIKCFSINNVRNLNDSYFYILKFNAVFLQKKSNLRESENGDEFFKTLAKEYLLWK